MEFAALIPIFSALIQRIFPDKVAQEQAKAELQKVIEQAQADQMKAQASVIVSETASTSWLAKTWRPLLMMCCVAIICNNWIFLPLLQAFHLGVVITPVPPELWTLVTVGLGGYIGHDTISTFSENKYKFNTKTFFDNLKKHFPQGLKQNDVEAINNALTAAETDSNNKGN